MSAKEFDLDNFIQGFEKKLWLREYAGGTTSSSELRDALKTRSFCVEKNHIARIEKIIDVWRVALKRHNDQSQKFVAYDIETGREKVELPNV